MTYLKLTKGFVGYLTGTGKSLSTVQSYKTDLDLLASYLKEKKKEFLSLEARDFGAYQAWLEKRGFKMNTRRRKVLTAKALVRYAVSRKKMKPNSVLYVKAPDRLERLPWIPTPSEWKSVRGSLPKDSVLDLRNQTILQILAESGLNVAELCSLRRDQVKGSKIEFEGKKSRVVQLSDAAALLKKWLSCHEGKYVFPGFNRHGITSAKMTPRGVELVFRKIAKDSGYRHLKPKTLRHFSIAQWMREGVAHEEIRKRLGVHSNYSLDLYSKHLDTRA